MSTHSAEVALRDPAEPRYPVEKIYGIVPSDSRKPCDVRALTQRALP